ncbi:MAG: FAD-dependent monooxygenase [Pseudomonadota bacterium]
MSARDLIICGGGIAGLTAALCAHHAGLRPIVYERAEALSEVGAGLQVGANAMKVLAKLGLAEAISRAGHTPETLDLRDGMTGHTIFSVGAGETGKVRWGQPHVNIRRAALQHVLATALEDRVPGALVLGAEAVDYADTGSAIDVEFSDGSLKSASAAIAADGIHSALRQRFHSGRSPDYTGHTALRALVPVTPELAALVPDASIAWTGPARHAVTYYLHGKSMINFVGVVERPEPAPEGWHNSVSLEDARTAFAGFATPVREILASATEARRWGLYDRPAPERLAQGRLALIGDAAVPMPPFMAQGASFAMECAWAAVASLASNGTFSQMGDRLRLRGARILETARRNGALFHQRGLPTLAGYGPVKLAAKLAPGVIRGRFDWIYGFDVTEAYPISAVRPG